MKRFTFIITAVLAVLLLFLPACKHPGGGTTGPIVTGIMVTGIELEYEYGIEIDELLAAVTITITYNKGDPDIFEGFTMARLEEIGITISGYDPFTPGPQTITVTYGDFETEFTITVGEEPEDVPVITIITQPSDISVAEGAISGSLTVTASVTKGKTPVYKWYSNSSKSNVGGTALNTTTYPAAATNNFTIPVDLIAANSPYYYFCEISAIDAVTVRSNAVIVTVVAAGTPVITITSHPADTDVVEGSISGSLSVEASVTEGMTPVYKWYSNSSKSNEGGTALNTATHPTAATNSFTIPTDLTVTGSPYYYFCEVSAEGAATIRSSVATITVTPVGMSVINITTQPAESTGFTQGAISGSLSVAATLTPDGTLTYQWYSNISASNTGGTPVNTATYPSAATSSFTIPTDLTAETYYYFCEVSAAGAESKRSNVAVVTVSLPKTISIGAQAETLNADRAGLTSFTVTTENIAAGSSITLNNTNAAAGIALVTTATAGSDTTVYISITAATPQGTHPLTLTIDGVTSSSFNLIVSEPTDKDVTVGPQSGALTFGTGGTTTFTVTTENIASGTAIILNNINTVPGITLVTTTTSGNSTTVSISTTAATPYGTHSLSLSIDGISSSIFYLVVSPAIISIEAIQGLTQPVAKAVPVTSITETAQYTGTVSWLPDHKPFKYETEYTATVTLTAKTGYTLTGVAADFFTVANAVSVSNTANSGVIEAVFPQTEEPPPGMDVEVHFTELEDETFDLTDDSEKELSWGSTITITISTSYDDYLWYLDGELLPEFTGFGSAHKSFSDYYEEGVYIGAGPHTINVVVKKGDEYYSKYLTFNVVY